MNNEKYSINYFKKWIKDPVSKLMKIEGNDGCFIVLIISLILYESHLKYIWRECREK